MIHEFHLSPSGRGRGISCDVSGAFIGDVPLLKRSIINGKEKWESRECGQLSKEITAQFGLPIDMSLKTGGIRAISDALNEDDVARAQIAAVLLAIPDLPILSKGVPKRAEQILFIRGLRWSGLIKIDWDPDEHPRWPAGAPDSQGGEFAPRGDDSTAAENFRSSTAPRETSTNLLDLNIGASSRPFDSRAPSNIQPALRTDEEGTLSSILDGSGQSEGNVSGVEDRGIYEDYAGHIGITQLASISVPMDGLRIAAANPANWANVARLTNGALELGSGQIITAAALLSAMDARTERAAVRVAINKFKFYPTNAADVLAARAYVWAQHNAPLNYFDVPWSGPQLESVSQSIMALELARPGTLYLALQGDKPSGHYISVAVEDGMLGGSVFESRRPENLPAALQTSTSAARDALNLRPNDQMRAHHLIPANVWEKELSLATLASQAGWQPDSIKNLIRLPANETAQEKLAVQGEVLPIHSSNHPAYDIATLGEIIEEKAVYYNSAPAPAQARAIFEDVAKRMERWIRAGRWMPRLR